MNTQITCNKEFCDICHAEQTKVFYSVHLEKGETHSGAPIEETYIAAVCEGELSVKYAARKKVVLKAGDLILFPKNLKLECTGNTACQFILCTIKPDMTVCKYFTPEHLESYLKSHPEIVTNIKKQKKIYTLPCDPEMLCFLRQLHESLYKIINCCNFQHLKREELFLYLRTKYSKEKLAYFFQPIMYRDINFRDFIFENYREIQDINKLAEIANMSVRTFNRKFKDTFQESPKNWLMERRAESIEHDIIHTELTFNEIANKHNFSSAAYMSNFCKKLLGKTPTEMRNREKDVRILQEFG